MERAWRELECRSELGESVPNSGWRFIGRGGQHNLGEERHLLVCITATPLISAESPAFSSGLGCLLVPSQAVQLDKAPARTILGSHSSELTYHGAQHSQGTHAFAGRGGLPRAGSPRTSFSKTRALADPARQPWL